jgi:hypothetical protein
MRVLFRAIRARAGHPKFTAIADEVRAAVDSDVKLQLIQAFNLRVANWEHKPEFKAMKRVSQKGTTVYVYPTGENANIWRYVSEGTRPHEIRPKGAGYPLKFAWGGPGSYKPKTKPPGKFGGPGIVQNAETTMLMVVHHPGNEPRNFEKGISEDFTPKFRRIVENAMRRGARKV